jgi:hypothetical protein
MKLFKTIQNRVRRRSVRGVTLPEMMVTVAVFLYIFVGTWMAVQLFGVRIYTTAATKLVATAGGREALNEIRDQIRESKTVYVGLCSNAVYASFRLITNAPQQGNALLIYPTTNANVCTIFYLDFTNNTTVPYTNKLIEFYATNTVPPPGTPSWITTYSATLAKYLTNQIVFDMEDWQTNIPSSEASLDNRLLVRVTMQFSQWEYPIAFIGTNGYNAYNYYQLRTRVYRRAWN